MIKYQITTKHIPIKFVTIDEMTIKLVDFVEILDELEGTDSLANPLLIRSTIIKELLEKHKIISTNIRGSSGCIDDNKRKEWLDKLYDSIYEEEKK